MGKGFKGRDFVSGSNVRKTVTLFFFSKGVSPLHQGPENGG